MILPETVEEIVQTQKRNLQTQDKAIPREALLQLPKQTAHALIISGIRRCGKSTLLRQLMKKNDHCCYFNFEDQRAAGFDVRDFEKLCAVLKQEYGPSKLYVFDEIQNVPEWERFVRRMLDEGNRFVVTGSNASLLSRELGMKLTGRHLSKELFPFSYAEFLEFTHKQPSPESFNAYLLHGGFPEFLKTTNIEILQELLQDILARDIIVRYGLRESRIIRDLALFLLTNVGKPFSYNALAKQFHLGSVNSIIVYISYFEDSYLLFTLPRFDYSLKKQQISFKKIYSVDTGLSGANSASFSKDRGRIFENSVFLHLRRKYREVFYFQDEGRECDFVIRERGTITHAVQVCYHITEENKDRELAGLHTAMQKLHLKEGLLVTVDQEDNRDGISIVPAWKWMLGPV